MRGPQHDLDAGPARQADPEEGVEDSRDLDVGQPEGLVQQDHRRLGIRADLGGGGAQGIGGLQGVPPLDASPTTTATADMDIEPADDGMTGDLRLVLGGHLGLADRPTTPGARLW